MCAGTFLTGDEAHFCAHSKIRKDIELQMMADPDDDATETVIYAFCSEFVSMCYQEVRMNSPSLVSGPPFVIFRFQYFVSCPDCRRS
jgi:hypothetical protein